MSKLVFLLKRKAGLEVAEFQTRWLDIRGPAIAGRSGIRRYIQSHPLPQGYGKGHLVFDGIEEFWVNTAGPTECSKSILGEELFDLERSVAMSVDVHVIR